MNYIRMGTTGSRILTLGGAAAILALLFLGLANGTLGLLPETEQALQAAWLARTPGEVLFWLAVTSLGSWYVLAGITATVVFILWTTRRRYYALLLSVIFIVSAVLTLWLKAFYDTPRPESSLIETFGGGFPSGHALSTMAVVGAINILLWGADVKESTRRWLSALGLLIILAVGLSRIKLGAHFFNDVLGGWLLGAMLVFLFQLMHRIRGFFGVKEGMDVKGSLVLRVGLVMLLIATIGAVISVVSYVI